MWKSILSLNIAKTIKRQESSSDALKDTAYMHIATERVSFQVFCNQTSFIDWRLARERIEVFTETFFMQMQMCQKWSRKSWKFYWQYYTMGYKRVTLFKVTFVFLSPTCNKFVSFCSLCSEWGACPLGPTPKYMQMKYNNYLWEVQGSIKTLIIALNEVLRSLHDALVGGNQSCSGYHSKYGHTGGYNN